MKLTILFLLITFPQITFAESDLPPCTIKMVVGTKCIYSIEKLHPTQPEVGQYQIEQKVKEFKALSDKKIEAVIEKKIVPVVIGPEGKLYLIDHHHNSLALLETGHPEVHVIVKENWSTLDLQSFWDKMNSNQYSFLKKADGTLLNPLSPAFPQTLRECGDNPYRSLVWILTEKGILKEGDIPYYEFYISDILKEKGLEIPSGKMKKSEISKYIKKATKILEENDVKGFVKTVVKEGPSCNIHQLLRNFK